jgi:hypothetical protein
MIPRIGLIVAGPVDIAAALNTLSMSRFTSIDSMTTVTTNPESLTP